MRQRRPKLPKLNVSGFAALAAALAVFAFVVVLLGEAFHIAHGVNDALLNAGEIFREAIPLGTIISTICFVVIAGGLVWFHFDEVAASWKRISAQIKIRLPVFRYIVGTISVVGLITFFLAGIVVFALVRLQHANMELQTTLQGPYEQLYRPNSTPRLTPNSASRQSLPAPATLGPRMAGRHVCELFEDPTDDEYNACMIYLDRNPGLKGTGGPNCVSVQGHIRCFRWSPPPIKPGPPLKILPNTN